MLQLIGLIQFAANAYIFIVIIRCVLSFVRPNPYNPVIQFIYRITDPLMDAIRGAFPFLMAGGFDLSPIVIIFLVQISVQFLVRFLLWIATLTAGAPIG